VIAGAGQPPVGFVGLGALRDPVLSGDGAPTVNSVTFLPGARTNWHTHADGQIPVVTSGRGRAGTRGGESTVLEPGDVVWFAPGEDHWHGAGPDTVMTHLAISRAPPPGATPSATRTSRPPVDVHLASTCDARRSQPLARG